MLEQLLTTAMDTPGAPDPEKMQQWAHQKRTMTEIRNLGTVLSSWLYDQVPKPGLAARDLGQTIDLQAYPLVPADQVRQWLIPTYLETLDATDGWGHPIEMRVNQKALQGKYVFCLRSPGRDGKFSGDSYKVASFPPGDPDQDIVWCDGSFVRWPEAAQKPAGQAPPR